jgi:hypothetical protein
MDGSALKLRAMLENRFDGAGFYRVHLQSDDGDWLQIFVPLDDSARLDRGRPRPYLFKSQWNKEVHFGELNVERGSDHRLEWAAEAPDSLTDLFTVPLTANSLVRVWENDSRDSDVYMFRVRSMQRL